MEHDTLALDDKVHLIGEIEHLRRHCLKSARTTNDKERRFKYLVRAGQAQRIRREIQKKWFDVAEEDWCLIKTVSTIKQLNSEIASSDIDTLSSIDNLANGIFSDITGNDISGCKSCAEDKSGVQ